MTDKCYDDKRQSIVTLAANKYKLDAIEVLVQYEHAIIKSKKNTATEVFQRQTPGRRHIRTVIL